MDTKEVNLDYFKHQSIQLLAIIKQLSSIEDQYDAIIYILSAINAYLKNIFTYNDREILKTKIFSSPELVKGHVNDVLQALKGDEKVEQSVTSFSNVNSFNQLLRFPYYIRSSSSTENGVKVLYKINNRHISVLKNPEEFSYKEFISWTSGINCVNKLKGRLKTKILLRRVIVPRPIKRSVSLSAADCTKKLGKHSGRSLSTNVRLSEDPKHSATDTYSSDDSHFLDSIDYDELILNPELEHKIAQVKARFPGKIRKMSKDESSNKAHTETDISTMDLDDEKLDEIEGEEDDDETAEPKAMTSDPSMPVKKPAKKRKTHPCLFCKKSYRSRKSLMLHFQHHPGFCPDCGEKVGFSAQEIVEHNRQFHIKERPIICEQCGESFTRNQQYQIHLQNHEKSKDKEDPSLLAPRYVCSECGQNFNNLKGLEKHVQETEHKQDKRLCDICGVDFDTNARLQQHVRRAHRPKSFACSYCSKEFTLKCNLDRHVKSLHYNNPSKLVCEHCGNEYRSQNSLIEHVEMAHKKSKVWSCNVCDKVFFIKRLLKVHEIVHSEYRPFQCEQCDQCYKRRSHLDRHIHFSHNKNGKVTRDSQQHNGEDGAGPMPKGPKKKRNPEEAAMKKKSKAQAAKMNATNQVYPTDPNQPTYGYDVQNYANTTVDYNNCGPDVQMNQMQMQGDPNAIQMYNTYNDQMMKYDPSSSVSSSHHPGSESSDFSNQYYLQENAVSWDNMQIYNNGAIDTAASENMNYSVVGVNSNDYMQPNMNPTMDKHQQQLMNIPNTDLFYNQDNMWNAGNPTANQGNTYNNIGNILTNLELIGNNSNFENSFDIVTSQGMDNTQPPQNMPAYQPDPQTYHHQPHPGSMQHHVYHDPNATMNMQQTPPPPPQGPQPNMHHHMNQSQQQQQQQQQQQYHHMNYGGNEIPNHTITDISNIQDPYKMKLDQI